MNTLARMVHLSKKANFLSCYLPLGRGLSTDKMFRTALFSSAAISVTCLLFILGSVFSMGYERLSLEFIFSSSTESGLSGGIFYQIIGTLILSVGAALIAAPFALSVGILSTYMLKGSPSKRAWLESGLYFLNATPSIVFGIFGYIIFVNYLGAGKSWLWGCIVMALMILPTVTISVIERLRTLPDDYIEVAKGLGLSDDQIITSTVIPFSFGGVLTGLVMGLARAAGETAPIMFTAAIFSGATIPSQISQSPVVAMPYHIFNLAQDIAGDSAAAGAWSTAFVLILQVLLLTAIAIPLRAKSHEEAKYD